MGTRTTASTTGSRESGERGTVGMKEEAPFTDRSYLLSRKKHDAAPHPLSAHRAGLTHQPWAARKDWAPQAPRHGSGSGTLLQLLLTEFGTVWKTEDTQVFHSKIFALAGPAADQ